MFFRLQAAKVGGAGEVAVWLMSCYDVVGEDVMASCISRAAQ